MKDVKMVLGENLRYLRKTKNITQTDLAKQLNYSDKAVSRWERGEASPDIESLKAIAKFYNVSIDFLVTEHESSEKLEEARIQVSKSLQSKRIIIALLWVSVVWILASVAFVYFEMFLDSDMWQLFVWGVPLSTLVFMYFNHKWNFIGKKYFLHAIFLWTSLICVYLQTVYFNVWQIFILGIPIQISLILLYTIKK